MTEPQEVSTKTGRQTRWTLAAGGLVLGVIVLLALFFYYRGRESTDDAQVDGHITQVSTKVGGSIIKVNVTDNQLVEAGAILVQLDPRDYQVAVDRAKGELADQEASAQAAASGVPIAETTTASEISSAGDSLVQARAGVAASEAEIDAAKSRLVAAQARLREKQADATRTARDAERLKTLIAKDEISRQQYDAVVASAEAATAVLEGARSDVLSAETAVRVAERHADQARAGLGQAGASVKTAETAPDQMRMIRARAASAAAKVVQAKAALDQAQLNLDHTTIKAPAAGVVSKRSIEIGQIVQAGQPLLALVTLGDVWITANFKETQIQSIRPGQAAVVSVEAVGKEFRGHVDSIAPATGARFSLLPPENASGNYVKVVQRLPVKIVIDPDQDPEHRLRPGMSADPTVYTR